MNRYKKLEYRTKDIMILMTAIPIVISVAVFIAFQVPA